MASVYQRSYRARDGRRVRCEKYTVECKIGDTFRPLSGYRDKKASEELGRKVERLASLHAAGEPPDAALAKWTEGLARQAPRQAGRVWVTHRPGGGRDEAAG